MYIPQVILIAILAATTAAQTGEITFISYDALQKNGVPCSRRGPTINNCYRSGTVPGNEYTRGCSTITLCARDADS
ncbi:hypothetical protein IG631_23368 [Alternaria alternata]|nr:hypothetical protein IG631_23368 [Alternaria alternata]